MRVIEIGVHSFHTTIMVQWKMDLSPIFGSFHLGSCSTESWLWEKGRLWKCFLGPRGVPLWNRLVYIPRDPITFWEWQWNLNSLLRRWSYTPIILWQGDWVPRVYIYTYLDYIYIFIKIYHIYIYLYIYMFLDIKSYASLNSSPNIKHRIVLGMVFGRPQLPTSYQQDWFGRPFTQLDLLKVKWPLTLTIPKRSF